MRDSGQRKLTSSFQNHCTLHSVPERAQELMKQYLDNGGHADGVFGHSDLGAIGAFLEAERRGIDKQMLTLIPHIILGIVEIKFAVFGFINGNFRL